MRKVFSNRELPHIWANQLQDYGRGSSMFFEKNIIYSYGKHFPIAEILEEKNVVFFNSNSYSNSTAKHKLYVRRAIPSKYRVFDTPGCSSNHKLNIESWTEDFNDNISRASTATLNRGYYLNNAKSILILIADYLATFGLKACRFKGLTDLLKRRDNVLPIELENKIKRQKKAERLATLEENKQNIQDWIQGRKSCIPYKIDRVFLRVNPSSYNEETHQVETSRGARVKYGSAKLLYNMIKEGRDIKGHKIDGYTVIGLNGVLKIGCHQIERKEIDRFAKSQNW